MAPKLIVSGPSLLAELNYKNTLLGLSIDDDPPATALSTLLTDTTWTTEDVDVGLSNVSARFDGVPVFNAILKIADILGVHVREVSGRKIDFGAFGTASGITLMQASATGPDVDSNDNVGIIQSIKVTEEGTNIVNKVIPVGAGEGNNLFQLGPTTGAAAGTPWSTRTAPYTIQSATGPNGETYYCLEDSVSVTTYGRREKVLAAKDIAPIANSPTAFENGANALYDLAAAYLTRFKDPLTVYEVEVTKLADAFEVGDTVRVVYKGVAETGVDTRTTWLSVDANLVVLEKTREFNASGADTWKLKVATVARWLQDDQEIILGALETLRAFRTAIKMYSFETNHGTERDSINSSNSFDYTVEYDDNVSRLHKVTLDVQLKGLKSNVTTTASEASHTHTVSGQTAQSGGGDTVTAAQNEITFLVGNYQHKHTFMSYDGSGASTSFPVEWDAGGNSKKFGAFALGDTGDFWTSEPVVIVGTLVHVSPGNHTHDVEIDDHTHSVSGSTSAAGTSHNHALTYGIFESTVPGSPGVEVWINGTERTAALGGGGGFGADFSVDISAYMVDTEGHPLRQANTVSLRTNNATAFDLIVQVRSFISASAIEAS